MSESLFYAVVGLVFVVTSVLAVIYSIITHKEYKQAEADAAAGVTRKHAETSNTALLGVVMPRQERKEDEHEK